MLVGNEYSHEAQLIVSGRCSVSASEIKNSPDRIDPLQIGTAPIQTEMNPNPLQTGTNSSTTHASTPA
ncbi:uncharacterized protein Nmag_1985 [Natrialba magadii ATCC 43099]|uniref:Uncharacterized protein n=1 Tax=Natrialba magadii (strain ATCC 43099 / DSM 3394 / CCM 3739 / CIP 104546 / IAM 13178 / JCM 8861 / NBRC 102185 / NCIMB 2190 / MS3) TaxID=547559 RepID=D3SVE8_NATMM|nr:uncharacterized protein Nmag_1985 [Natrialba magadii ATCC 43099]